ncbi:PREDICTED: RIB43A-like with coiled-coils protein 1 [Cyprinodon variegatus]|uniref:RIB43A-like with coiled-coils protein 1 n=1 Tax=Cyprinodon variegatus TaxID=28743 RepID=UPI000742CD08|nr:PREDICTED: RIB43A-like with coiled-coils protein 1 [Cyprinodon variegatus]
MFKADLTLDQQEEKTLEARRSAERARKARIYNTRLRVMGLDLEALNQQVQEKKHRQNLEKQRDKAFDAMRRRQDEELIQQDSNEKEKRKAMHRDLTQHWASQQQAEHCRDDDLKGAFNITIPESELGPASMQTFKGEGVGEDQREQRRKTERDLQAQMDENKRREMRAKHKEILVNKDLVHQDLRGLQQAALEEDRKKAARIALDNYNQALAAERAEFFKEQHRREERENLEEMWHTATSDMMTECPEQAERFVGGGRPPQILPDRWKGMSPEHLSLFHREREQQCLERQRKLGAEQIKNKTWDLHLLKLAKEAEEKEQKIAELRREKRMQLDQYNKLLAREQQANQDYLEKELYTSKPTKDYFYQFNTSSR